METNVIRPRIFQKSLRLAIFILCFIFLGLGVWMLARFLVLGYNTRLDVREWSFVFYFILGIFMILVYRDQEEKSKYYIRWTDTDVYYKLDKGPEQRLDLSQVDRVNANYSKVFFYMKDGSVKLVNFYSLDPRFKDIQKAMTINDKLKKTKRTILL